jgi:hypothetical protein
MESKATASEVAAWMFQELKQHGAPLLGKYGLQDPDPVRRRLSARIKVV